MAGTLSLTASSKMRVNGRLEFISQHASLETISRTDDPRGGTSTPTTRRTVSCVLRRCWSVTRGRRLPVTRRSASAPCDHVQVLLAGRIDGDLERRPDKLAIGPNDVE